MNACIYFDMKLTVLEIWTDTFFYISAFLSKKGQIYDTANRYATSLLATHDKQFIR